jgi:hypothetical protein
LGYAGKKTAHQSATNRLWRAILFSSSGVIFTRQGRGGSGFDFFVEKNPRFLPCLHQASRQHWQRVLASVSMPFEKSLLKACAQCG